MPTDKPIRSVRSRMAELLARPMDLVLRLRVVVKFLLHLAIFIFAYSLAYVVRFDFYVPQPFVSTLWKTIPVLLVAKALGFLAFGLFHGWWRYVSIRDVFPITAGCTLGSLIFRWRGLSALGSALRSMVDLLPGLGEHADDRAGAPLRGSHGKRGLGPNAS